MKRLCFIFILVGMALMLTSCRKELNFEGVGPEVSESSREIRPTKVTFTWTVNYPGKVCSAVELGLNEDMSDAVRYGSEEATENKDFTIVVDNLHEATQYYYRYVVWNSFSVFEMKSKYFSTTTIQAPTVCTETPTDITENSAVFQGAVADDGGTPVLECGFFYGQSPDPVTNGTQIRSTIEETGGFSCSMSVLENKAVYYIRAYAINERGIDYGDEIVVALHPIGAIGGLFCASPEKQVYFSQGNLQYRASDNKWRFAEHQYDCIGEANASVSESYDGWIDLFGWGTSGFRDASDVYNTNYHPFSSSTTVVNVLYNYCGYGPSTNMSNPNLTGSNYDWGIYNPISNGGDLEWWTLSKDEWEYVLNTRETITVNGTANARYAKATVAEVRGIILFPDQYIHPSAVAQPFSINLQDAFFESNSYTADEWAKMEACGAVFLPAAGSRNNSSTGNVGINGSYWSATNNGSRYAYCVSFHQQYLYPAYNYGNRESGISVRLVRFP